MGTRINSVEGFTDIQVLNEEALACYLEVNGSQIKLSFEDYDLAQTIIKSGATGELIGFKLQPKFAPR